MKNIAKASKEYYFLAQNTANEVKGKVFQSLFNTVKESGVQVPGSVKNRPNVDDLKKLYNRRAGIEPLIGHAKKIGLRKSRAHSGTTILASGYRAIMRFNPHQLKRDISKPRLVSP